MSSLFYQDILFIIMIWFSVLGSIVLLKNLKSEDNEKDELRRRMKELEEMLKMEKMRCDELLRDAAIKNVVMSSLYRAWEKGGLKKCYEDGGDVKVLLDGTVICERGGDKSYLIYAVKGGGDGAA